MLWQADEHFKVVVPFFTSLSPNQACAITPIKYLASTILTSFHVMDTALSPALCEKLRHPFARTPLLLERAKTHIRQNLEDAAGTLRGVGGNVTAEIVLGSPRRAINAFAGDWQADLVTVGSSKLRPWERQLIGSIPRSVFRRGRVLLRSYARGKKTRTPILSHV
jgi:nucleotide-binding universal stress UspA family protein